MECFKYKVQLFSLINLENSPPNCVLTKRKKMCNSTLSSLPTFPHRAISDCKWENSHISLGGSSPSQGVHTVLIMEQLFSTAKNVKY